MFMRHVRPRTNGCWEWTAARSYQAYGISALDGRKQQAHRVSYQLFVGKIALGRLACHRCDHPWCVNPKHLFIGTQQDNMSDMKRKGRSATGSKHMSVVHPESLHRGEAQYKSKLTEHDVKVIRQLVSLGQSCQQISDTFNINRQHIGRIKNRKAWRHIQ